MQRDSFTIVFANADLVHPIENSCGKKGGKMMFEILARARDREQLSSPSSCRAQLLPREKVQIRIWRRGRSLTREWSPSTNQDPASAPAPISH